jgi:hypothetical protein
MKTVIVFASFVAAISAFTPPHITGTTPPAIDCPNKLCHGKYDGNYEIDYEPNYFVQCVSGSAYCQACWPLRLEFSGKCNQCLYKKGDDCVTTEKWHPATTFECPDKCPHYGPNHSGNVADPYNPRQYVACWKGVTVGCIACPGVLEFSEKWNACLYEGKYMTQGSH